MEDRHKERAIRVLVKEGSVDDMCVGGMMKEPSHRLEASSYESSEYIIYQITNVNR